MPREEKRRKKTSEPIVWVSFSLSLTVTIIFIAHYECVSFTLQIDTCELISLFLPFSILKLLLFQPAFGRERERERERENRLSSRCVRDQSSGEYERKRLVHMKMSSQKRISCHSELSPISLLTPSFTSSSYHHRFFLSPKPPAPLSCIVSWHSHDRSSGWAVGWLAILYIFAFSLACFQFSSQLTNKPNRWTGNSVFSERHPKHKQNTRLLFLVIPETQPKFFSCVLFKTTEHKKGKTKQRTTKMHLSLSLSLSLSTGGIVYFTGLLK